MSLQGFFGRKAKPLTYFISYAKETGYGNCELTVNNPPASHKDIIAWQNSIEESLGDGEKVVIIVWRKYDGRKE